MLETNGTPKSYVATSRRLPLVKAIKWAWFNLDLSTCQKGGAPLLRGGALLFLQKAHTWHPLSWGTHGCPHLTLGCSLSYTWCALFSKWWALPHGNFLPFSYLSKHPPIASVSSSWVKNCFYVVNYIIIFYIGIKKGFGGKLGVDLMCGCSLSFTNLWGEIVLMHFFQLVKW